MDPEQNKAILDIDPEILIEKIATKLGNDVFEVVLNEIKSINSIQKNESKPQMECISLELQNND